MVPAAAPSPAQAIIGPQVYHQLLDVDGEAHLPTQYIPGHLIQRLAGDLVDDGQGFRRGWKDHAFQGRSILFEPLVGTSMLDSHSPKKYSTIFCNRAATSSGHG